MPLIISKYHEEESFGEYFNRDEWKGDFEVIVKRLKTVINLINSIFSETEIFGFFSHRSLFLMDKDYNELTPQVSISCSPLIYDFRFKVSDKHKPWDDAWMTGKTDNEEEVLLYLTKSFIGTDLWIDNPELEDVAEQLGIEK